MKFNILEFYRGRHTYVGIDTLAFSSNAPMACAASCQVLPAASFAVPPSPHHRSIRSAMRRQLMPP